MQLDPASLWPEFKKFDKGVSGTVDDTCADAIRGPRLDHAVQDLANGYLKKLEFGPEYPENKATDERARLLDLHWGKIEYDAGMLEGLGAAIAHLRDTLTVGVGKLGESWKGESYEAFKTATDKICTTLSAYADGASATGEGLRMAMANARSLYEEYAQASVSGSLNFDETTVSPPEQWHKMTDWDKYSGRELAECCPSEHETGFGDFNSNCLKDDDEQRNVLTDNFVTQRWWNICKKDGCEENAGRVLAMYSRMVDDCEDAREDIKERLDLFFRDTKDLVDSMTEMMSIAVGNLNNLASAEALTSLRVIAAGGGQPVDGGGDTGGGGYPGGGGGYPSDSGGGSVGIAEPMQPVEEPPASTDTEPAAVEPVAEPAPDAAATQPETVEIKDGDHTISVTSPDGEGRVTVTVDDGSGKAKTYELDFDAASGMAATPPATTPPHTDPAAGTDFGPDGQPPSDGTAVEQVPARSDGKCVIQDGPLTITAERPLFAPDSVTLTVDNGSGTPTTYTLDFATAAPAEEVAADPAAEPVAGVAPPAVDTPGQVPESQVTTPQAWTADQSGSVSGVLVPEQSDGEAGLASAPDAPEPQQDQSTGMAGSGLPMMGAPGGGSEAGRAGSGWSVHGDLFDSAEPVYSMHGVLGDDEHDAER